MNKNLPEGKKQAEDCYTVKHHTHWTKDNGSNEGNEGDRGGATETMIS